MLTAVRSHLMEEQVGVETGPRRQKLRLKRTFSCTDQELAAVCFLAFFHAALAQDGLGVEIARKREKIARPALSSSKADVDRRDGCQSQLLSSAIERGRTGLAVFLWSVVRWDVWPGAKFKFPQITKSGHSHALPQPCRWRRKQAETTKARAAECHGLA